MKNFAWILIALCATAHTAAACDLDCQLATQLREEGIAGAVYSLVDGQDTRVGAVGLANRESGQPMRPDSKVHIGSVAKTLLALGVLRLATEGRVSLDAPLAELLPTLRIENPWQARSPLRLRHLLDQTSGLEDLRLWQLFSLRVDPRAPLGDAFTRAPDLLRARTEPGKQFSYSNTGYTLAGMVIEVVTGERYESWLDRELLRPLGMNDSTFEFTSQQGSAADPRLAWGHHDDFSLAAAQPVWVRPAAQVTTTAGDMARVARLLMSDGRLGAAPFIEPSLLRQMGRARTLAASAGLDAGYALGLATRDRHGAVGLCHTGNIVGYRGALCVYPERGKAFFIALNTDSESAEYTRFDDLMIRTLGVSTPVTPASTQREPDREWHGRYVLAPGRFDRFRYFDLLLDSVSVRAGAEGLEIDRFGGETQQLTPVGPRLYRAAGRTQASHVFLADGQSRLLSDGTRTLRRIDEWRFITHWLSLALGLAGLIGFLVLVPWRAWRRGESALQPATLALVLLLAPLPLFAMQSFMALGDVTAAGVSLYAATLLLPFLMLAQALWAWSTRARLKSWLLHVVAAVLVLQWCASLYAWDLLPLALWR